MRRRLLRVHPRRRPYYLPWERLEILWHRARHRLSIDTTVHAFAVTRNTILNWERAVERKQLTTVRVKNALSALPDLVAELVHRCKLEWPGWGTRRISGVLAQMGVLTSRTTVQRILRRRRAKPASEKRPEQPPVKAKHENHIWMADFTRLNNGFRTVWVGAVIDAFSRRVLALVVVPKGPSARATLRMLRHARRQHGSPRLFITDKGPEFTAGSVGRWASRKGIGQRFGAIGRKGSIALIERFWRSMKDEYARGLLLYRSRSVIQSKLRLYARWFNTERPHQGVGQRAPDQVFFRRRRRRRRHFERGRLEVQYLAGDRRLPVLRLRRAA